MPILQQPLHSSVTIHCVEGRGAESGKLGNGDLIDNYSSHKIRYERVGGASDRKEDKSSCEDCFKPQARNMPALALRRKPF